MAHPRPRPTRMKILEGNPGHRVFNKEEAQPEVSDDIPEPPAHLLQSAKEEWKSIAAKLYRCGLLTEVDTACLALYCQAYGRWVDAESALNGQETVIRTTNGNLIQNPHLGIANKALRECHKLLVEFGMTPSSRSRVSAKKSGDGSKFDGLINHSPLMRGRSA